MRREDQREHDGYRQRTEVIESEHLRHQILERQLALQNAHNQRDFQSNKDADAEHHQIEHQLERRRQPSEHEKQRDRRKTAEQPDHQLDLDEAADQVARDVLRQPRADAHREQVGADHRRELHHRIAEQVGRQGAGHQLVGQPAGSDDENGEKKGMPHVRGC